MDLCGALKGRLSLKIVLRKCRELYQNWLEQQAEDIPENDRLKFGRHWVRDWCKQYSVSLRKPNKRFAIGKEDRIERIEDYLKNVWTIRKYFFDTYVLIVIGGGITGDVQINVTHVHHQLKTNYREQEMEMMLPQLDENPTKIPAPSRDEMLLMMSRLWENMVIDEERAFKTLFVTSAFDGSDDYLVSDKLFQLVGAQLVEFRVKLKKPKSPKSFQALLRQIILPKGIRRKNLEGSEMFDCEDEEIEDEEVSDVDEDENDAPEDQVPVVESDLADSPDPVTLVTNSLTSLTRFTNDPDIIKDALFLDKLEELIKAHNTSKVFTPHISQFKKSDLHYFTLEENMQEEGPSQSRSPTPSQSRSVTPIYFSSDDESSLDDHQENASLPPRSPTHAPTPGSSGDEDELAENTAPQVDEC